MSGHKKNKAVLSVAAFLCLVLLCSCNTVIIPTADLATAIEEGIIASADGHAVRQVNLVDVQFRNIYRQFDFHAQVYFPNTRQLSFARYGGEYSGAYVSVGDRVMAGDLLAEQSFIFETTEIERDRLLVDFAAFENRAERDRNRITNVLERERFFLQSVITRRDFERRLSILENIINPDQLIAPINGVVTYIHKTGEIRYGLRIAEIIDDDIAAFTVSAPPTIVRYGDVFPLAVQTQELSLSFDVKVISDPLAAQNAENNMTFILSVVCMETFNAAMADANLTNLDLRDASIGFSLTVPMATNTLMIPRRAVFPEDGRHFVYVYENGNYLKRYIIEGMRYGNDVQILFGLEPGQRVVLP